MNLLVRYLLISLLVPVMVLAGPNDPITGKDFDRLLANQNFDVQNTISEVIRDSNGLVILGPFDPFFPHATGYRDLFLFSHAVRVVCPDRACVENTAAEIIDRFSVEPFMFDSSAPDLVFFSEKVYQFESDYLRGLVRIVTVQETRRDIWWRDLPSEYKSPAVYFPLLKYLDAIDKYLNEVGGSDSVGDDAPLASDFDLPDSLDFYAPPPDYVIQGYQNYKDSLRKYSPIRTDFANGVVAFVPSDSLLAAMKENAPRVAYPNKESLMLQHEYKKFFDRGGDVRVMQTLSKEGLDTLQAGEYFFAVGLSGRIRFGRELLREEVKRIEVETGKKVPRANHAFLFPGQPILTAGAFFLEGSPAKLVKVNAQSGHYFYSNVSPTIQRDISVESDKYLMTLGHFFRSLDSLGIEYEMVLISKQ